MLALKKKAAAAAAAAAAPAGESTSAAAGGAGSGGGSVSIIEGDVASVVTPAGGVKKITPGELRVQKDIAELDAGKVGTVTWPSPDDVMTMHLTVKPDTGLWAGGTFVFCIKVTDMYPHTAPLVTCLTKIYHPNIDLEGKVCLNILRDGWKPVLDINAVIYGLIVLFYEPEPTDPLNLEAAAMMRDDRPTFEALVKSTLRGGAVRVPKKGGGHEVVEFKRVL